MHGRIWTFRSITLALLAVPMLANAANLSFLDNSTVSKFKPEDVKLLMETVDKVLDSTDAKAAASWSNAKTGNSGEVAAVGGFNSTDGHACKRLKVINRAKAMASTNEYVLCQVPGRGWLLNPEARPAAEGR